MEAKDIVEQEVARQKEFGYEPSWEDFVIAGKQAGIREVVEWYEEEISKLPTYPDSFLIARQAKRKEWGIEM